MMIIQMMIRMMGMPIVTVPNAGHTDSRTGDPPTGSHSSTLRPCHHIQHLARMAKLTKVYHIQYLATIPTKNGQMAKYALRIPLRPAHHIQDPAKISFWG